MYNTVQCDRSCLFEHVKVSRCMIYLQPEVWDGMKNSRGFHIGRDLLPFLYQEWQILIQTLLVSYLEFCKA